MRTKTPIPPGEKHNMLTFVVEAPNPGGKRKVLVECECGQIRVVRFDGWKNDHIKSCGCHLKKTHGLSKTGFYKSWGSMKQRCQPEFWKRYPTYTGVQYDPRWETFNGFMAFQPTTGRAHREGLVLARFGDIGDYTPENTRWATKEENQQEMTARRVLRLPDGRPAGQVARANGVGEAWKARIRSGEDPLEAVTRPVPEKLTPEEARRRVKEREAERSRQRHEEAVATLLAMEWGDSNLHPKPKKGPVGP